MLPFLAEVLPLRVRRFDQSHFLTPQPALDLLLADDGRPDAPGRLIINQAVEVVVSRESGDKLLFVF